MEDLPFLNRNGEAEDEGTEGKGRDCEERREEKLQM